MSSLRVPALVFLIGPLVLSLSARASEGASLAPSASQGLILEREDNDSVERATNLGGADVVGWGNVYPTGDVDYFAFQANAGERVYAATMTSGSSSNVFDTVLALIGTDGVSVLESDNDDGSLGGTASSIAGHVMPSAGTYYVRVTAAGVMVRPYFLHLRVQPASATPEAEPNNTTATANLLPAGGHVSGAHLVLDLDWFRISLNAGDSLFVSLDADPERDLVTWNPRLAVGRVGDAGNQMLSVDDANATSPNSEAVFITVRQAGTYYVRVDSAGPEGGTSQTFNLSVSVHPATPASTMCTTYSSDDVPVPIADGAGPTTSTLFVPGNPRILDLDVTLQLNHPLMADLDGVLQSPSGSDVGLFTDIGATATGGQSQMDVTLDDEAALPISAFPVVKGMVSQTEPSFRLGWFDGQDAGGTWTLRMWDDVSNGNVGSLTGWSITICSPPAPEVCLGTTVTVFSTDFESDESGFTHSGTPDEWQRGLPSGASAPILGCNSGSSCWKTNLTGVYSDDAFMLLSSPVVSLAEFAPPIRASWAQASQMENASFDAMEVDVTDVGNGSIETLYLWLDGTQDADVGVLNSDYVAMSSGWSQRSANLDAYAGSSVRMEFGLASDIFLGYSGLAIDDVTVTACCTAASCNDDDPCTSDTCDAALGCVHFSLEGKSCDDGDSCTTDDLCSAGQCAGTPTTPASEVDDSLRLSKSGTSAAIDWSGDPGPFNVYRGTRGAAGWSYNHVCIADTLATPPALDALGGPSGIMYYYLVTRETCLESIPGRDSTGTPIPNPNPCP